MCMVVEPGRADDADDAAELLYETDRAFFAYLSGGDRPSLLRLFADEWRRPGSPLYCGFSRVVREQGQVIGLLVGYRQDEHAALDFDAIGCASQGLPGGFLEHFHGVYEVAQYLFPVVPPGAYYVQNLTVAAPHQGRGLGRRLMEDAFDRAQAARCATCHLDVDSQTRAVEFYDSLGMQVLVETRVQPLAEHDIPPHFRMVRRFGVIR
jgi:ribosomal protein S18 acetylase RimI-like enzyme